MYKLIAFFCLIPLLNFAQPAPPHRYLTYTNKLTEDKNGLNCVLDSRIIKSYVQTYNCYDKRNRLVKQLNCRPRLGYSMNWKATHAYAKYTDDPTFGYLIGDLKNGKPYNGFFINNDSSFWLIFDFYLNGERIWQFYNDLLTTNRVKDTQTNYTILDNRSVFIHGRLQSGLAITSIKKNGTQADIATYVSNYKNTQFMLMFYGENFGDFIKISPSKSGYLLESLERNSIQITYRASGRTITIFDKEGKTRQVIDLVQFPKEGTPVNKKGDIRYFRKGNNWYAEQAKKSAQPFEIKKGHREEYSAILPKLAYSLYTNAPLETADLKAFAAGL